MLAKAQQVAAVPSVFGWHRRYTIVVLFFLATMICYIDRVNISVAIIPMARDKGYDPALQGLILSSFFWGYMLSQLAGGWVADRFGGKWVLGFGVACWSLATFCTPLAAAVSLPLLLVTRVLLGLGEGVNFPAIHSLASRWLPPTERARALALSYSGLALGTVVALLASPPLILRAGWPTVFYLSGTLGALWLIAWTIKAANGPEVPTEAGQSFAEQPDRAAAKPAPLSEILREKAVWAIVVAHFCNNFGFYILLLWLPSYFSQALKVPMKSLGEYSLLPWLVIFTLGNISGWLADLMIVRGFSVTLVRKLFQTLAFLLGALPLFLLPHVTYMPAVLTLISISACCGALALSAFGVNHLDIGPNCAGMLMGLSNTAGTVPGIIGVAITGIIVQATGSFSVVFYLTAVIYLIGLVAYLAWGSGERKF